jgi:hypothetical protein
MTNVITENILIDNDYIQKSIWKTGLTFVLQNINL